MNVKIISQLTGEVKKAGIFSQADTKTKVVLNLLKYYSFILSTLSFIRFCTKQNKISIRRLSEVFRNSTSRVLSARNVARNQCFSFFNAIWAIGVMKIRSVGCLFGSCNSQSDILMHRYPNGGRQQFPQSEINLTVSTTFLSYIPQLMIRCRTWALPPVLNGKIVSKKIDSEKNHFLTRQSVWATGCIPGSDPDSSLYSTNHLSF